MTFFSSPQEGLYISMTHLRGERDNLYEEKRSIWSSQAIRALEEGMSSKTHRGVADGVTHFTRNREVIIIINREVAIRLLV